jgi:hypothetical protein
MKCLSHWLFLQTLDLNLYYINRSFQLVNLSLRILHLLLLSPRAYRLMHLKKNGSHKLKMTMVWGVTPCSLYMFSRWRQYIAQKRLQTFARLQNATSRGKLFFIFTTESIAKSHSHKLFSDLPFPSLIWVLKVLAVEGCLCSLTELDKSSQGVNNFNLMLIAT